MVKDKLNEIRSQLPAHVALVAVSKTHPPEMVQEAYDAGQRLFGENKVQELLQKQPLLPPDIEWHLIGHLQTNKVRYIAPFISLVHSVDSLKLLAEIDKQALRNNRVISCLLQLHIAQEETKFGFSFSEAQDILLQKKYEAFRHVNVCGLMGMASFTGDEQQVRNEFAGLKKFYDKMKEKCPFLNILSMGMSSDYKLAIAEGSNMVRIGSSIFGLRERVG